jgi:uncharacterized protein involved in response to NO
MKIIFTYAFRPLFLLATVYAVLVVPLWAAAWLGYLPMPTSLRAPTWWHAHEMIYGFAGAAIGGFALTAVATWTKRPPVSGLPLMILSALWLIARLLFVLPFASLLAPAIAADLGYGMLLFVLMSREVIAARSQRNYKVLVILGLLPVTNALFFLGMTRNAGWTMTALFAGLWLVIMLINLIGGRVIPGFTRNWMKRQLMEHKREPATLPPVFDRFDLLTTWLMVAFAILHLLGAPSRWTAVAGLITSVLLFIRLTRWQGIHTGGEPLVWVLHVAFSWLPLGFLLLAFAELGLLPRTTGIHALTSGHEPPVGKPSGADGGLCVDHDRGHLPCGGDDWARRPCFAGIVGGGVVLWLCLFCLAVRSNSDAGPGAEARVAADAVERPRGTAERDTKIN